MQSNVYCGLNNVLCVWSNKLQKDTKRATNYITQHRLS